MICRAVLSMPSDTATIRNGASSSASANRSSRRAMAGKTCTDAIGMPRRTANAEARPDGPRGTNRPAAMGAGRSRAVAAPGWGARFVPLGRLALPCFFT